MTPGEYKRQAALTINYGFHVTPYGDCLIATTDRGICALRFVEESFADTLVRQAEWPQATLLNHSKKRPSLPNRFFMQILPKATTFTVAWHKLSGTGLACALLQIPRRRIGQLCGCSRRIGHPTAARAVSGAIAHNPVGYLIPCHRVISKVAAPTNIAGVRSQTGLNRPWQPKTHYTYQPKWMHWLFDWRG